MRTPKMLVRLERPADITEFLNGRTDAGRASERIQLRAYRDAAIRRRSLHADRVEPHFHVAAFDRAVRDDRAHDDCRVSRFRRAHRSTPDVHPAQHGPGVRGRDRELHRAVQRTGRETDGGRYWVSGRDSTHDAAHYRKRLQRYL